MNPDTVEIHADLKPTDTAEAPAAADESETPEEESGE